MQPIPRKCDEGMPKARKRTAIVYDFDGTLARGNIQEHSFLPGVAADRKSFWRDVKETAKHHDADEILVYMWKLLECARSAGVPVTSSGLREHGRSVPLFEGVRTWFSRINCHASPLGLELEHYLISSGTLEILRGCEIFDEFKGVFASRFIFDDQGKAIWPGLAINYTTKTQYLFRINKGITNAWDNEAVNRWIPMDERPIPFSRMIFIGDGDTDIPSMKMVRYQGGHSVAVSDPEAWENADEAARQKIFRLISEDRVHFVAPADYSEGTQLDITIKGILGRIR
jgi:hypothetical protein